MIGIILLYIYLYVNVLLIFTKIYSSKTYLIPVKQDIEQ